MNRNSDNTVMGMVGDVALLLGKLMLWLIVCILKLLSYLLRATEELLRTILN